MAICLVAHSDFDAMRARLSEIKEIGFSPVYVFLDGVSTFDAEHIKFENQKIQFEITKLKRDGVIKEIFLAQQNLGVGAGLLSASDWFFSLEDFGIILEDDCQIGLGAEAFAKLVRKELAEEVNFGGFCLTKYLLESKDYDINSPHGTNFFQSWGWGTSAEIWREFRASNLEEITKLSLFGSLYFLPVLDRIFLTHILWKEFSLVRGGKKNLWAVLFTVFLIDGGLRLSLPIENLVVHQSRSSATNVRITPKWYEGTKLFNRSSSEFKVDLSIQKSYERMLARNIYGASFSRLLIGFVLRSPLLKMWAFTIKRRFKGVIKRCD
jgi:hypothetical protein